MLHRALISTCLMMFAACGVGEIDEPDDEDFDDGLQIRMGLDSGIPIKAAKWWNPLVPDVNEQATTAGLELPQGISYAQAVTAICELGVEALFIRKGEPKIMNYAGTGDPCHGIGDAQCRAKINGKLADALEAIKNDKTCAKKPVVYIMQRQQLTTSAKIEEYAGVELKELLDELGRRGVKGVVKGIALVESHLDGACAVKNRAVEVAQRINAHNGNWLKNKSLFVGGAGLGMRFKNLNTNDGCSRGLRQTLADLAAETGQFSFIYKHFDNGEVNMCNDWSTIKSSSISVADAKAYLLDGCPGVRDLVEGVRANRAEFPAHANVTFWGDEGDGITNIPPNVLAALHQIFVADRDAGNFKHVAFNRLFDRKPTTTADACPSNEDHCKHLIEIDGAQKPALNRGPSKNGLRTSVFDTWDRWQTAAPGYAP